MLGGNDTIIFHETMSRVLRYTLKEGKVYLGQAVTRVKVERGLKVGEGIKQKNVENSIPSL